MASGGIWWPLVLLGSFVIPFIFCSGGIHFGILISHDISMSCAQQLHFKHRVYIGKRTQYHVHSMVDGAQNEGHHDQVYKDSSMLIQKVKNHRESTRKKKTRTKVLHEVSPHDPIFLPRSSCSCRHLRDQQAPERTKKLGLEHLRTRWRQRLSDSAPTRMTCQQLCR